MQQDRNLRDGGLTISEAAALAGRSYSWARDRVTDGRFECLRSDSGRTLVTTRSVAAAIARESAQRCSSAKRGGHLRLIIDNTK